MIIGVYDSGIGGLTTLTAIRKTYSGHDFYYLADNAGMPFGSKSPFEIYKRVKQGLTALEEKSDVQVVACNTASTVVAPDTAFLLHPRLAGLRSDNTLVLATPATLSAIKANENMFNTANTTELATLVEIAASLAFKHRNNLDFGILTQYLCKRTEDFREIKTVVLGCSHYVFLDRTIGFLFPDASVRDGNAELISEMKKKVPEKFGNGNVNFAFTGANEEEKYRWILEKLI